MLKTQTYVLIVTRLGRLRLAEIEGANVPPKEFKSPTGRLFKRSKWGKLDIDSIHDVVEIYEEVGN